MTHQKHDDEIFVLTPLGVLSGGLNTNEAQSALDALELYMRRHGLALAVVGAKLEFVFDEEARA
jgi:hypothetical protein